MDFDEQGNIVGNRPAVRYIKLGANNAWTKRAFADGEIPFSYREVSHELALTRDVAKITVHLQGLGKTQGAAANIARQVCNFYDLDGGAIWITFADGLMWWTQPEPEVLWLGESDDYAPRIRRARGGWSNSNKFGVPYYTSQLSSRLTKVASTQQTLCKIAAEDYALRKIYNWIEPAVLRAQVAKAGMLEAILDLIGNLHWSDFETLVDLLLARNGWHRISSLGGTMKDADLVVEQLITKEKAFVQVKSASNQREFDHYVGIFGSNSEWSRMIYACHTPVGPITSDRNDVMVWARSELADMVLRNGLFDWLVARTA